MLQAERAKRFGDDRLAIEERFALAEQRLQRQVSACRCACRCAGSQPKPQVRIHAHTLTHSAHILRCL